MCVRIEIYGNNKFLAQINNKAELFGKMAQVVKLHLSKNSPAIMSNYAHKKANQANKNKFKRNANQSKYHL